MASHYTLNKIQKQKLKQKSKSTLILSYLPSNICRYCKKRKKKSGHCKYNCPALKKKHKIRMAKSY